MNLVQKPTGRRNVGCTKLNSLNKSMDYKTSTGTYHRFIPPVGQDFHARVLVPNKRIENPVLKANFYLSDNHRNYCSKACVKNPLSLESAQDLNNVQYLGALKDKLCRKPSAIIKGTKSDTRDFLKPKPLNINECKVFSPNPHSVCDIRAFGRDEQPPILPEKNGYFKHLDIYLTTTRASYVPYDEKQQNGIARKDIITFYDASGTPKGGKGFGPRDDIKVGLLPKKVKTKEKKRDKSLFPVKPFKGESEYKDNYIRQTFSNLSPFLFDSGVQYNQNNDVKPQKPLSAPAMYVSENCIYGSGIPVCSVIQSKTPVRECLHKLREYCT